MSLKEAGHFQKDVKFKFSIHFFLKSLELTYFNQNAQQVILIHF